MKKVRMEKNNFFYTLFRAKSNGRTAVGRQLGSVNSDATHRWVASMLG